DFDPVITVNSEFLHAYYSEKTPPVPPAVAASAREAVAKEQGISLSALLATVEGLSADRFYKLLVNRELYVPIEVCQLVFSTNVQVYTDRVSCEALAGLLPPKKTDKMTVRSRFPRFDINELITIRGQNLTVVVAGTDDVQFR